MARYLIKPTPKKEILTLQEAATKTLITYKKYLGEHWSVAACIQVKIYKFGASLSTTSFPQATLVTAQQLC